MTSDVDDVLDDALADFEMSRPPAQHAAVQPQASSSSAPATFDPLRRRVSRRAEPAPDGKGKARASVPTRFDPLRTGSPRPSRPALPPAASEASFSGARPRAAAAPAARGPAAGNAPSSALPVPRRPNFGAVPPDLRGLDDEMAQGLSALMAELAQVDSESQHAAGGGPPGSGGAPGGLGATLAALATQSRSHAPGGAARDADSASGGSNVDEALLHRLAAMMGPEGSGAGPRDGSGGAGPEGAAFASFADSIMGQLLSKDVLYQPMKEIGAKYPAWLAAHRGSLLEDELQQFEQQHAYIQRIVALYEAESYDNAELFGLVQEMQACGQPPQEIVDDLAPGLKFDGDGLPLPPATAGSCPGAGPGPAACRLQ